MNKDYSDQIIDSFLQEFVSDERPPDLSRRIAAAWDSEQGLVRATPVRVPRMASVTAAKSETQAQLASHSTCNGKSIALKRKQQTASFRRNLIAALLAVGACGLLAFLGARLVVKQQQESLARETGPSSTGVQSRAQTDDSMPVDRLDTDAHPSVARKQPIAPEALEIDDLPFTLDKPAAKATAGTATDSLAANSSRIGQPSSDAQALSDDEIVQQMDLQLKQLWQDLKIVPTEALSAQERANQMLLQLTGQSRGAGSSPVPNSDALAVLVKEATATRSFARVWANKLTKAWFTQGGIPLDDPRIAAVQQKIAEYIESGTPFNRIPIQLLGSEIQSQDALAESRKTQTATPATTFLSAWAGNGNHRLVTQIGNSFLDTNLACVRCHETNPSNQAEANSVSNNARSTVAQQKNYWSLVALLQGIEVRVTNPGQRLAVDMQAERLASGVPLVAYYDLLDGRLQAADPVLPDGQAWREIAGETSANGPRNALAAWLSQSTALDEATVSQVWKIVFGRPLISQVPLDTTVDDREQRASAARRELQLFLAGQYRSHGHDLRRLVSWIVRSDAFARQSLEMSRAQWLDTSDDELRQWQLSELNFATGPLRSPGAESASLESSLAAVLNWQGKSMQGLGKSSDTTLAQPTPTLPMNESARRKLAQKQTQASTPSASYSLHGELASPQDADFVSRLLASTRLSWDQCVMHIVLINPDNTVNGRVKHLADELLRQHGGDARSALLDLLWAVRNSDSI